jgi:hypothetical protein
MFNPHRRKKEGSGAVLEVRKLAATLVSVSTKFVRRKLMKRNLARTTLLLSVAALCLGVGPVQAAEHCSNAKAAGQWGFTLTGTLFFPTPIGAIPGAAIGRLSVDAAGNISGTESRSVGGGFANETITGTWSVNSDCTSRVTANIYESGVLVRTSVLDAVFVDHSNKIRAVQESLTNPDGSTVPVVITLEGNKLFNEGGD